MSEERGTYAINGKRDDSRPFHCGDCGHTLGYIHTGDTGVKALHVIGQHAVAIIPMLADLHCQYCGGMSRWSPKGDAYRRLMAHYNGADDVGN